MRKTIFWTGAHGHVVSPRIWLPRNLYFVHLALLKWLTLWSNVSAQTTLNYMTFVWVLRNLNLTFSDLKSLLILTSPVRSKGLSYIPLEFQLITLKSIKMLKSSLDICGWRPSFTIIRTQDHLKTSLKSSTQLLQTGPLAPANYVSWSRSSTRLSMTSTSICWNHAHANPAT